jgi:hypothetical protein
LAGFFKAFSPTYATQRAYSHVVIIDNPIFGPLQQTTCALFVSNSMLQFFPPRFYQDLIVDHGVYSAANPTTGIGDIIFIGVVEIDKWCQIQQISECITIPVILC